MSAGRVSLGNQLKQVCEAYVRRTSGLAENEERDGKGSIKVANGSKGGEPGWITGDRGRKLQRGAACRMRGDLEYVLGEGPGQCMSYLVSMSYENKGDNQPPDPNAEDLTRMCVSEVLVGRSCI